MTMPSISRKLLLGMSLAVLLAGGCKERQEPAPPEEPPAVRKRIEVSQPPPVQVVKPGDMEPETPVPEEVPPKPEAPEAPPLEVAEVKAPVEEKAPTPKPAEVKPTVEEKAPATEVKEEPEKVVAEPDKEAEAATDASTEPPSAPETPSPGAFTINLASFKLKEKADQYAAKLKKREIDAYVWKVNLPEKGTWYRVAVGQFPTLEEAKTYKEELKQKEITGTYITKIPESS